MALDFAQQGVAVEDEEPMDFSAGGELDFSSQGEVVEEAPVSNYVGTRGNLGKSAKAAGYEFLAATDAVLGLPGAAIRLGLTAITDAYAFATGDKTPFKSGRESVEQSFGESAIGKFLMRPIETLTGTEKEVRGTLVSEVFNVLGDGIKNVGERIGGGEVAEATGQATEVALMVLGAKGFKADLKRLKDAPVPPVTNLDDVLAEYDVMKANEPKPQLVNQDELPFTNSIDDAPRAQQSALPENYYQPELKFQDELPLTNEATPRNAPFSQLVDTPTPTKQDMLDLSNTKPAPRQPDMFEPQANEAFNASTTSAIDSTLNKYKYSPKVQDALELSGAKVGSDGRATASSPERVIQEMRAKARQDFLKLELPTKASTPVINKFADEVIAETPLPPELQAKPLEALSKELSKEEWTKEFLRRNPNRNTEAADFAFQRLNPEKAYEVSLGQAADDFFKVGFGTFFTRLGNVSESLLQRSITLEENLLRRPSEIYKKMDEVFVPIKTFSPKLQDDINTALFNKDRNALYTAFAYAGRPDLFKVFDENILKTVRDLGDEASVVGAIKKKDDYFLPQVVKDYPGLLKAMGKEVDVNKLEAQINKAEKEAYSKGLRFGDLERTQVINKFLRGSPRPEAYKSGYRKERKFDVVPEEYRPFYYKPQEALQNYVKNAIEDIETFKFLGKNVKKDAQGKLILEDSIGAYVDDLLAKGKIDASKADELQRLYTARFVGGNRSPNKLVQSSKNLSSGLLLSGLSSTAIQLTEVLPLVFLSQPQVINGLKGAMKVAFETAKSKVTGKVSPRLDARDLGLVDHYMNTEIQTYTGKGAGTRFANATAALADVSLKLNLFKNSDAALKSFGLNTSLKGAEYQLNTPKGRKLFADDWRARYGEKLPQLMKELQAGEITPLTTNYAFSQLAKTQAVSKGNWTVWSLDNPNARIMTTLKTFAINQLQLIKSEGLRKIEKGQAKEGVKSLAKVATGLTLAGMASTEIRNFLMGRETDETLLAKAGLGMLKVVGMQEKTLENIKQGNLYTAAKEYIAPPTTMFNAPLEDLKQDLTGGNEEGDASQRRYLDLFPYGREIRSNFFGGAEKFNEEQSNREQTKLNKE